MSDEKITGHDDGAWPNPLQECGHCTALATHGSPMCAEHANPSSIPWPVSSNASHHGTLWVTHDRRYGTRDSHHSEEDARREAAREPAMIDVVEYESRSSSEQRGSPACEKALATLRSLYCTCGYWKEKP